MLVRSSFKAIAIAVLFFFSMTGVSGATATDVFRKYPGWILIITLAMVGMGAAVVAILKLYGKIRRANEKIKMEINERKQIEKELKAKENHFRDIYLCMADWIWEVDAEGRYTFSSGNVRGVLGYGKQELIGKTPFDFMPKDEAERVKIEFEELKSGRDPIVDLINWNLRKDGTRVCLLTNGVPIFNADGEFSGYRGVDKDITAYYLAEEKVKQSLKFTETIIENLPIGMMIVGKDKKIRRINHRALEIIGFDSEKELIGKMCHDNICPAQKGKCPVSDLGKTVDRSERIAVHKDGRHIPILKTALPITINDEEVVLEAFMDITERKQAEKALRTSEKRHRTIMDTFADPVVVYDNKGQVTYLNPAFTEIFGWASEELLGERIDFVPEEAVPETQKAIETVLNGENLTGFETRRFTKDGKIINVRIGAAMLRDESGTPAGIVVNFQDITAQKRILAELECAKKDAEAATKAKSEFLANMSHEIRTPMNAIIGMSGLLLDTDLDQEQREYAETVRIAGDGLLGLINDILDFSKIESGKFELEEIPFDLRYIMESVGELVAPNAQAKGLEVTCFLHPESTVKLIGDPERLRQVLVNLASNAVKFTERGNIDIRVEVVRKEEVMVFLRFEVLDTGIGIPQDRLGSIFEGFTQADGSTTRRFGGTGLGLSISKELTQFMGGKIGVESEEGKGSTFWLTIPFRKQEKEEAPMTTRKSVRGAHILIVDDNATNRTILNKTLVSFGCFPEEVSNGKDALSLLNRSVEEDRAFDAVLLDHQMPGLDGEDVARAIQADSRLRNLRLLILTSIGQRGDLRKFKELGCSAYLTKPVRQSQLLDALAEVLVKEEEPEKAVEEKPSSPDIITRHSLGEMVAREARILLAEDNVVNQKVAIRILEKGGHRADAVANGKEALKALKRIQYDIVLMDVQMPEMDGYAATREIRNPQSNVRDIPVIAMTAHAMKGDREKCLAAGMDDYISKPVKPKELLGVVQRWAGKQVLHSAVEKRIPPVQVSPPVEMTHLEKNTCGDTEFDIK